MNPDLTLREPVSTSGRDKQTKPHETAAWPDNFLPLRRERRDKNRAPHRTADALVDSRGTGTRGDIARENLEAILTSFQGNGSEVIPILQRIQAEFGCLPDGALLAVSQFTGVPESRVYALATFYADFHLQPLGAKHVRVCRGASCYLQGAAHILKAVERQLGIKAGETTADRVYSLGTVGCTGTCARAPCIMMNDKVESKMTPQKVAKLFGKGGQYDGEL
jgi:NADH-quinone oxidoreductase subunit E